MLQQDHVAAGIAQAGMDGLEAVQIQQRQSRRAKGIAQRSSASISATRLPSPVKGSRGMAADALRPPCAR